MIDNKISVSVSGTERLTREVSQGQVQEYLRAKGWEPTRHVTLCGKRAWARGSDVTSLTSPDRPPREVVDFLATYEGRSPAKVLCEIAGDADDTELAQIRRDIEAIRDRYYQPGTDPAHFDTNRGARVAIVRILDLLDERARGSR